MQDPLSNLAGNNPQITNPEIREAKKFKTISDNANYGIAISDLNGNLIYISEYFAHVHGYKPGELIGENLSIFHNHEQLKRVREINQALQESGSYNAVEVWHKHRDNSCFPMLMNGVVIKDKEDRPLYMAATAIDITQHKKAEKTLRENEEKYRAIFEQASESIVLIDAKTGALVEFNDKACEILGYTREEFRKLKIPDFEIIESADEVTRHIEKIVRQGADTFETKHRTKNGQILNVQVSNKGISIGGKDFIQSMWRDITGHRKTLKALRDSKGKYRLLVENANEGIIIAQHGMLKFVNPKVVEFTGYSKKELISKPFVEFIHPDDKQKVLKYNIREIKRKEVAHTHSFRIIDKEGNIRWVKSNAVSVMWEGEDAILSFLTDITDHKRVEEELKQSLEKLRRAIEGNVKAMAIAAEVRDPYTAGHQRRVSKLACAIAKIMGIAQTKIEGIRIAATLHDIGKIHVPAEILSKPCKLTKIEMDLIRTHPKVGYDILKTEEFSWPIAQIILQHHERIDGTGYPNGLSGEDILLEARILGVADVVEAMASHRPYRPALGIDKALEEISNNAGILYDVNVTNACLMVFAKEGFSFE